MAYIIPVVLDTMLVRQVPPDRSVFEQVVFVAAGVSQVVTLIVVVLLAVIFYRMWKAQMAMQEQLGRLSAKVDPMIASATTAAENVRVLTDVLRRDAAAAAEALSDATARVRDSVSGIADRIDEFGALLGRVTDKAEAVADVAEAAVSTFKAGRRLFRAPDEQPRPHGEPRHPRPETRRDAGRPIEREAPPAPAAPPAEELDEPIRLAEEDEGHESPYAEEATGTRSRPRRRRHRRRRGGGASGGQDGDAEPRP